MKKYIQNRENREECKSAVFFSVPVFFVILLILTIASGDCDGCIDASPVAPKTSEKNVSDNVIVVSPNTSETTDKSVDSSPIVPKTSVTIVTDEAINVSPVAPETTVKNVSDEAINASFDVDKNSDLTEKTVDDSLIDESHKIPQGLRVLIERCVDGDTLIVRYEEDGEEIRERVRLIGVNTPETVKRNWPIEPFGSEASEYTKKRVEETGNVATLVSDGDEFDKYNRRLAFVYLGNDTISLNEDLARQGLGTVELQYNYSQEMKNRLQDCANAAKRERLGIYSGGY